eukprot:gene12452-14714_t
MEKLTFPLYKMTGTWCSEELKLAVNKGYKIIKIHHVVHWEKKSKDIFVDYINLFMKLKQQADGYPKTFKTIEGKVIEIKTEDDKDLYIKSYFEIEGILLDKEKIEKNSGLRSVCKLFLNNLWGRYTMRENKRQSKFLNYFEVYDILTDDRNSNVVIEGINDETNDTYMVAYNVLDEFAETNYSTNAVI